jgi:hypothetical protein
VGIATPHAQPPPFDPPAIEKITVMIINQAET